jgi:phosphatidyl-myo-inositol dimannoside synthase
VKTLVITPNFAGADGISSLSRAIARAFDGGCRVIALHDRPSDENRRGDGVDVQGAGGRRARFGQLVVRAAARADAAARVVCTHVHLAPSARVGAWRASQFVVVLCGIEAWVPLTIAQRRALERADRIVAISRHTAERFRRANPGCADLEIAVCHPGLPDCGDSSPPRTLPGDEALIVARMSASERYKGHDALIEVWPALVGEFPEARLCIAGDGDDRPRLEERAAALGVGGAVRFTGGTTDAELAALYAGASFVFLEAMRAGLACIGAPGAAAEIIDEGRTGFLVQADDRERLASHLRRLFGDRDLRERLGAAGRRRFLERFTDRGFAVRLHAALDGVVDPAAAVSHPLGGSVARR